MPYAMTSQYLTSILCICRDLIFSLPDSTAINMIKHSGYLKTGPHLPSHCGSEKSALSRNALNTFVFHISRVDILFDCLATNNLLSLWNH
jgi:hypothetical protein